MNDRNMTPMTYHTNMRFTLCSFISLECVRGAAEAIFSGRKILLFIYLKVWLVCVKLLEVVFDQALFVGLFLF